MKFEPTLIPGAWIVVPERHGDSRGYFCEVFRKDLFEAATGRTVDFIQDNESESRRGVLRGLHYQAGDAAQAKLVRVSQGRVLDVAVDLRRSSPAYGRYVAVELSQENGRQFFVPRGCAHGFLVLSESAQFQYKVDSPWAPQAERCIRWDDPEIGVEWPVEGLELILSPKDSLGQTFSQAEKFD